MGRWVPCRCSACQLSRAEVAPPHPSVLPHRATPVDYLRRFKESHWPQIEAYRAKIEIITNVATYYLIIFLSLVTACCIDFDQQLSKCIEDKNVFLLWNIEARNFTKGHLFVGTLFLFYVQCLSLLKHFWISNFLIRHAKIPLNTNSPRQQLCYGTVYKAKMCLPVTIKKFQN